MQDNFFDEYSEPTEPTGHRTQQNEADQQQPSNEQQNHQFAEYQVHRNAHEDEYQQFQDPTPAQQHLEAPNSQNDYYFENVVPEQVTPEMLELRRRDEEIQHNLEKKRSEEKGLKEQRKEKGKRELQQFKTNRVKEVEKNRERNEAEAAKVTKSKQYGNEWEKVADNIGLKAGEYPGKKDVTRMKDAIVKKSKD